MKPDAHSLGSRQAALLVHSMNPRDRRWVMNALPEPDRAVMYPLLKELRQLGISPQTSPESLLAPTPAQQPPFHASENTGVDALKSLTDEQVTCLAKLLGDEPPHLVARFLCMEPWTWKHQFLSRISPLQRRNVVEAQLEVSANSFAPAPSIDAAILTAIELALSHHRAQASNVAKAPRDLQRRRGWVDSLAGRMNSLRRASAGVRS